MKRYAVATTTEDLSAWRNPANLGRRTALAGLAIVLTLMLAPSAPASAQQLDLAHGGPIGITASDGIEWRQADRQVIARGNARAVRGTVTVTADRLIAYYRPKAGEAAPSAQAAPPVQPGITGDTDAGGNEIYRVQAEGHVVVFTPTDKAQGDRAVYDLDQAILLMTGHDLKLTTPTQVLTARDTLEYWAQKHMAVARGNAVAVTNDGRRIAADTLVAYTTDAPQKPATPTTQVAAQQGNDDPLGASGKLEKVEAFGNVSVRTVADTATGDRAVYVPETGIARLAGRVRITHGQNQLDGSEAEVNMKTGISRLLAGTGAPVQGLVVPSDTSNQELIGQPPGGQVPGTQPVTPKGTPK